MSILSNARMQASFSAISCNDDLLVVFGTRKCILHSTPQSDLREATTATRNS